MDHPIFDHPHKGTFLPHVRRVAAEETRLMPLVKSALGMMVEGDMDANYPSNIAHALGEIYACLDSNYLGKKKVPSETVIVCWEAWLETDIAPSSDPWLACLVNLLHAYGADMEGDISDPTGTSSTLRKLFSQDDSLGPYMQLDRTVFLRGILESATPKAAGHVWRRSL